MSEGVFDYKDFREKWDILLETKKYRQCEKLCHDGLAQSPPDKDRGKLYNHLGYLYENYLEDKTFDDILEHYVLSLQVDESNSNSHFNLANFLLEQGMQHLLRALELNDKHSKANKKLAQLSPLRVGSSILLGNTRYRCIEVTDDVVRCVKLRQRYGTNEYEIVDDEAPVDLHAGTPDVSVVAGSKSNINSNNNNKHGGNHSVQYSHDPTENNGNNSNKPGALNIEDGKISNSNNYYQLNGNSPNNINESNKCGCKPCILNIWIWIIIWFLAIIGIAAPIVGWWFQYDWIPWSACETFDEYTINEETISSDLTIRFIADCNNETGTTFWSDQTTSIQTIIDDFSAITSDYQIRQVCDNVTTTPTTITSGSITQENSNTPDIYFSTMLRACYSDISSIDGTLLCVIMALDNPQDPLKAINYIADIDSTDIYLTYITYSDSSQLSAFLGSLSYKSQDEDISWWNFTVDSTVSDYCQHCLYYDDSNFESNSEQISQEFSNGIMEKMISIMEKEACEIHMYFWYAMGGAGPLLICVFCLLLWICKRCCCNRNKGKEQENNNNNNNHSGPGSSQQSPLNAHHSHQNMQKETAYV